MDLMDLMDLTRQMVRRVLTDRMVLKALMVQMVQMVQMGLTDRMAPSLRRLLGVVGSSG